MLCVVQKGQRHRSLELKGQATVTLDLCFDTGTLEGLQGVCLQASETFLSSKKQTGAYDSPIPNYSISTGGSTGSHKPPTLPLDSSPHKLHSLQGSHEPWVSTHRGGNATGSVLDQREGGRVALRVAFSTQPGPAGHRGITGSVRKPGPSPVHQTALYGLPRG